jgi:integrase
MRARTKGSAGGRREARGSIIERELKSGNVSFSMRFRPAPGADKRCDLLGYASEGWTRERAEEALADTLAEVRTGTWIAPEQRRAEQEAAKAAAAAAVVPTFAEYVDKWLNRRKARPSKPRTVQSRQWSLNHLVPWFGPMPVNEIHVDDVDDYVAEKVAEGLAGSSVNRTLTLLSTILTYAAECRPHHCPVNPAAGHDRRAATKRPSRIVIDETQTAALLAAAAELDTECRQKRPYRRALLATLLYGGMRIGELLALTWDDIDLGAGKIEIRESKTSAGERTIDIQPELHDHLVGWKMKTRYSNPSSFVFPTQRGRMDHRSSVRQSVLVRSVVRANERIAEYGGCDPLPEELKLHDLRRTYCSWLFTERCTLPFVMAQMGHRDSRMTMIYAQAIEAKGGRVVTGGRPVTPLPEWAALDTKPSPVQAPAHAA